MGNAEIYSHANYLLLEPDIFGRVGGGFVRDVILTSFWQKHIFDPSLSNTPVQWQLCGFGNIIYKIAKSNQNKNKQRNSHLPVALREELGKLWQTLGIKLTDWQTLSIKF